MGTAVGVLLVAIFVAVISSWYSSKNPRVPKFWADFENSCKKGDFFIIVDQDGNMKAELTPTRMPIPDFGRYKKIRVRLEVKGWKFWDPEENAHAEETSGLHGTR